eukprot:g2197.t1
MLSPSGAPPTAPPPPFPLKIDIHNHVMPPASFFETDWFAEMGNKGTWVSIAQEDDGSYSMYKQTGDSSAAAAAATADATAPTAAAAAAAAAGQARAAGPTKRILFRPKLNANIFDMTARLRDMDASGTDIQVMSIVPVMWNMWLEDPAQAGRWTRALNAAVLDQTRACPSRLLGMGAVPLQHPELAATILEECHAAGLKAIQIPTHVPQFGDCDDLSTHTGLRYELGDTRFEPFFKRAAELGMPIFVHPWYMSYFDQEDRITNTSDGKEIAGKGAHWAPWLVGMPSEEANCMLQIMASGVLHKYPTLKICISHGSGAFPCLCGRIKHGAACKPEWVWPVGKTVPNYFRTLGETSRSDTVDDYLKKNFYADSLTLDAHSFLHVLRLFGDHKVLFGTDFPFPLGSVAEPPGLVMLGDERVRRQVLRENALEFLGMEQEKEGDGEEECAGRK